MNGVNLHIPLFCNFNFMAKHCRLTTSNSDKNKQHKADPTCLPPLLASICCHLQETGIQIRVMIIKRTNSRGREMMKGPEEREEKTDRRKWSTAMMLGKNQNLEFKNLRQNYTVSRSTGFKNTTNNDTIFSVLNGVKQLPTLNLFFCMPWPALIHREDELSQFRWKPNVLIC